MKLLQKIVAGFLIAWGALFLTVMMSLVLTPPEQLTQEDREAALGCAILGFPPAGLGSWMIWRMYQQAKSKQLAAEKSDRDELNATFFRILQENQGKITVLRFSMEAKIPAEEAQKFLDGQAKAFNASFEVDEQGGIDYIFNL